MVVIYDRFVFFSVEKFFIPLLYSCLNILVQKKLRERKRERESECMRISNNFVRLYGCECVYMCMCIYVRACERGGGLRKRGRKRERVYACVRACVCVYMSERKRRK